MAITDREAPGTVTPEAIAHLEPEARERLRADLAKAEGLALQLAQVYGDALALLREPTGVDLGDPLALFRLPSGAVGYETTYADEVRVGEWVQRCHGDPDWHLVEDVVVLAADCGCGEARRITLHGQAYDWLATDAIRVARPPADVIARQERGQ